MQFLIVLSCLVVSTLASRLPYNSYYDFTPSTGYYQGPLAPLDHDGQVVDTPEVAHAKEAHLSAFAAEAAKSAQFGQQFSDYSDTESDSYNYQPAYHGPPAPLGPDGQVVDTPEVARAKAAHLAAHAVQLAKLAQESQTNSYSHPKW